MRAPRQCRERTGAPRPPRRGDNNCPCLGAGPQVQPILHQVGCSPAEIPEGTVYLSGVRDFDTDAADVVGAQHHPIAAYLEQCAYNDVIGQARRWGLRPGPVTSTWGQRHHGRFVTVEAWALPAPPATFELPHTEEP